MARETGKIPYYTLEIQGGSKRDILVFRDLVTAQYMSSPVNGIAQVTYDYPSSIITKDQLKQIRKYKGGTLHDHVGGSVDADYLHYSWAVVFFNNVKGEQPVSILMGTVIDPHKVASQVTQAELSAAHCAIEAALRAGVSKVIINHDYRGVDPREVQTVRSKKADIVDYKRAVALLSEFIDVRFCKIKSKHNVAHEAANRTRQDISARLNRHLKSYLGVRAEKMLTARSG